MSPILKTNSNIDLWCLNGTNHILVTSICKLYIVKCVINLVFFIWILLSTSGYMLFNLKIYSPHDQCHPILRFFFHFNVHVLIHLSLKSLFLQCSRFYIVSDEFYCIIPCTNFPHTKYIVLLASPKPSEAEIEPCRHTLQKQNDVEQGSHPYLLACMWTYVPK